MRGLLDVDSNLPTLLNAFNLLNIFTFLIYTASTSAMFSNAFRMKRNPGGSKRENRILPIRKPKLIVSENKAEEAG